MTETETETVCPPYKPGATYASVAEVLGAKTVEVMDLGEPGQYSDMCHEVGRMLHVMRIMPGYMDYLPYRLSGDTRFRVELKGEVNYDQDRCALIYAIYFEGAAVAIFTRAGRGGDGDEHVHVLDRDLLFRLVAVVSEAVMLEALEETGEKLEDSGGPITLPSYGEPRVTLGEKINAWKVRK